MFILYPIGVLSKQNILREEIILKNKTSVIIWVVAVIAVMAAAFAYYNNNKDKAFTGKSPVTQGSTASQTAESSTIQTSDKASSQDTSGETSLSQEGSGSKVMAPDFELKDLDGNSVKLSDYRGKIVILNFWAVWCKYCKLEMPDLNELNSELEKDGKAVILAVDSQESKSTVKSYLDKNNIKLKVLLDSDGAITQTYGITGFPTTFILNTDGSVYTYIPGATDKATLLEILDKIEKGEPAQ